MKRSILFAFTALALAKSVPAQGTNPLRIVCPPDRTNWVCSPTSSAVVTYPSPTVTDNCTGTPTVACTPPSGAVFILGTTVVTCRATNACGESAVCSFKVTLAHDTISPVIQCPTNRTVVLCGSGSTTTVIFPTPTATDNADTRVAVTCSPASGSSFPVGTTPVVCTARDDCGNTSTCTFSVTVVRDTTPPVIQCPSNLVFNCLCPGQVIILDFFQATATDDYDPKPAIVCDPPSLVSSPGVHVVTCTATDNCRNSSRCQFTVTFNYDTIPPVIQCPTNRMVWTCNSSAVVDYAVRATDTCDPNVAVVCTPPSGSAFPLGTTTVTCVATDRCTNQASCTFKVTVAPSPVYGGLCHLPLGSAALTTNAAGELEVSGLGASGQDGVRIELGESRGLVWRMRNPAGTPEGDMDIDIIGRTTAGTEVPVRRISHHYRDGRHSVTPGTGSYEWKLLLRGQVVFRQGGQTGDIDIPECHHVETEHCVGEPFAGLNPYLPYCFNVLTVECDWDTPAGPVRADTLVLTPEDPLPPLTAVAAVRILGRNLRDLPALTILEERRLTLGGSELQVACPPNLTVPTCSTNPVPVTFLSPLATGGNCSAPPVVTCVPPSGSLFPPGATTVVCTATNVCGERDACTFVVTVIPDTVPPVVVCPTNIVVEAHDALGVVVTWPNPEATDNLTATPKVSCLPPSGTVFPIGRTTVICEARDECDHRSRCSFTVTVTRGPGLPGTDTGNDGLSDIWQAQFGANGLAPEEDTDGDRHTNFQEQVAGTDPFDPASRAEQKDLGKYNRMFEMYSKGVVGKHYQLQVSPELGKPWTDIGPSIVGTGAVIKFAISLDDPNLPPSFEMQGMVRFSVSDVDADGDGVSAWEESIIGTSDLTPNTHGNPGGDYQAAQDWIARHRG